MTFPTNQKITEVVKVVEQPLGETINPIRNFQKTIKDIYGFRPSYAKSVEFLDYLKSLKKDYEDAKVKHVKLINLLLIVPGLDARREIIKTFNRYEPANTEFNECLYLTADLEKKLKELEAWPTT